MSRLNHHHQTTLTMLVLAAALACERDKQDPGPATSATTEADETSNTGNTTTTGTADTGILDATESTQTASTTAESSESSSTGSEPGSVCAARLTKEVCNKDHHPQGLGYEFCLWVNVVTWDANTACPDLATGEGTCIQQDFTNDCSYNPTCSTHERIFARLIADNIYEAFAHPNLCGTPLDYELCSGEGIEPVCSCFGCQ